MIPAALALVTLLLLFSLRALEQTADGLNYALSAKTGEGMLHPHHLLYAPIVRGFLLVLGRVSDAFDAVLSAQVHNSLWSAVAVVCMYLVVGRLLSSRAWGLIAALTLLIAQGFWTFSTQVEVYVPATGALMLLAAVLLLRRRAVLEDREMVLVSLVLAMAVFYHQTNVLFAIPLGYYLLATQGRDRVKILLAILGLAGLVVFCGYVLAFLYVEPIWSVRGFVRFCLSYTFHLNPQWGTVDNLSIGGVRALLRSQYANFAVIRSGGGILAVGFGFVVLLLALWNLIRAFRLPEHSAVRGLCVLWLAVYFAFFLWWLPAEHEFFVTPLVPILLLGFMTVGDLTARLGSSRGRVLLVGAGILVALLWGLNLKAYMPQHRSRGPRYQEASALAAQSAQRCVVCTNYAVLGRLRFYFEEPRVLESHIALVSFYRRLPLPDAYRLEKERCILIHPSRVVPDYRITGFDGYRDPEGWLRFAEWLFDFEYDAEGAFTACRDFELVGEGEVYSYLRLLPSRIAVDGLGALFERLDEQVSLPFSGKADSFRHWLSTVRPNDS